MCGTDNDFKNKLIKTNDLPIEIKTIISDQTNICISIIDKIKNGTMILTKAEETVHQILRNSKAEAYPAIVNINNAGFIKRG